MTIYSRRIPPMQSEHMTRRRFIKLASAATGGVLLGSRTGLSQSPMTMPQGSSSAAIATGVARLEERADYTIRIGTGLVEVGPQRILSTATYNGQFPGPILRLKEGRRVVVDIHNDTDTPEQLHWHGQFLPTDVDGVAEEGTPYIPAHGMRRIAFTPGPSGIRFYHTHLRAGSDLHAGQYSGLVGPVYIEARHEPGAYDQEIFLTLKEFEPFFKRGGDMGMHFLASARTDPALKAMADNAELEAASPPTR